ncbi:putative d-lactate dehydrogenase [Phaeomoniella chlamydospora]|uniref:Putative d-lactate dehydrogenase n=1 Tax=Phaeomoniella chlamydospora TaxID=158046 RepID=A0A0G2E634_PHACM|nr:putative d-lactate dehydrogenase [Phaeomoniella chlamydospora]
MSRRAAKKIESILGDSGVSYDEEVIEHHGYSEWSTSKTAERPVAVVYPTSTEEVSQIVKICDRFRVPIVPFGAGSSVEGNFFAPLSGISIDFSQMNKIVAFHEDDMDIVVQPGVNWVDMNNQIHGSGLFLPMDPSPTAQIGGMISTNCSGTNAMRYGTMKDWVLNITAVLADGSIIKTRHRPRKTSAGYNLTSLFVGAEGTLGIVTEATLKLAPIPQDTSVAIVPFPTVHDAAAAASDLIRSGIQLGAMELMDDVQMQVINQHGSAAVRKRSWKETPTLFLKFSGTTEGIKVDIKRVREIVAKRGANNFVFAKNKQEETDLWAARKEALWTMLSVRPDGTELWSTDVAVPISKLADIIAISKEESGKLGLFASVIGHVGDGNFHQAVMYDPKDEEQTSSVSKCVEKMMDRAIDMEGTVSGEHGIGLGKKHCLAKELGPETIAFMQTLKRAVDPKYVLTSIANLNDTSHQGRVSAVCG